MKITFVRHFETPWNQMGKLQGSADISISAVSEALLTKTQQILPTVVFDKVYVSSLKRTQQTAAALGYRDFEINPLLAEIDFKQFEGLQKADLLAFDNGGWVKSPFDSVLQDSLQSMMHRIDSFLDSLQAENVLVVGHGAWLRLCYAKYKLQKIDEMNQISSPNGWVWTLEI